MTDLSRAGTPATATADTDPARETPTAHLTLPAVLAVAFLAMFAQDVLGTAMVIFEAHFNGPLAALMDELQWVTSLVCSALAIGSILDSGWRSRRSLTIIAVISAANIAGTLTGVTFGHWISR